ncbi:hypothetical protein ACKWTF_014109 [Chironomus riparius]
MKIVIAITLIVIISAVSAQKSATKQDPMQIAASQIAGYINNFKGTSEELKADLTSKASNEKGTYSSAQIDSFCKGVCAQLSQNAKISCAGFTAVVKTYFKATN